VSFFSGLQTFEHLALPFDAHRQPFGPLVQLFGEHLPLSELLFAPVAAHHQPFDLQFVGLLSFVRLTAHFDVPDQFG
jgi:hypothetical protein